MRKTSKSKWWVITPNVIEVVFNQCLSLLLSGIQYRRHILECKISELFKGLKQVWTWTCVCSYISCKSFKCFVTLIQYAKCRNLISWLCIIQEVDQLLVLKLFSLYLYLVYVLCTCTGVLQRIDNVKQVP